MAEHVLVIGNKNYSSWSLRGWLAVRLAGIPVAEQMVMLRQEDTKQAILEHSPSGKVPVLKTPDGPIWDSLAIGEYLADLCPDQGLWPRDRLARARARCVVAEMHSGFADLRTKMPMDMCRRFPGEGLTSQVQIDIDRICEIWRGCRAAHGQDGPFLFGRPSLADAAYAPVVSRFLTYDVALDDVCTDYCQTVMAWAPLREWVAAAALEPEVKVRSAN